VNMVDWILVGLMTLVSSARITRLVVFDTWPPVQWVRDTWDRFTATSGWNPLLHCPACFSVWAATGVVLWGYFTDWGTPWWIINGVLAAAYAAQYVVVYDGLDD